MRMTTWKIVMVAFLTLLVVVGTTGRAQAACAVDSSGNATVTLFVPFGTTSVPIAPGGPTVCGPFTLDTCPGCIGQARAFIIPAGEGGSVDQIGFTDVLITTTAPGTLTLNFSSDSSNFVTVPTPGPYARATMVNGTFVPGGLLGFGGISYTATVSFDVINNIVGPGPLDVGPTLTFANDNLASGSFNNSALEMQSYSGSEGGPCTEFFQGSVVITFLSASDMVFIPDSVRIAAARIAGDAGVAAVQAALQQGTRAVVQPPIGGRSLSVFNANRGSVPAKWRLMVDGAPTCALPPATIALSRVVGAAVGSINQADFIMPSDTGSSYRNDGCQYVYNLDSGMLGPGTYLVTISIPGPTAGTVETVGRAVFSLR